LGLAGLLPAISPPYTIKDVRQSEVRTGPAQPKLKAARIPDPSRVLILQVPVAFFFEGAPSLTKEMFLNNRYGGMDEREIKIIDVFICKLSPLEGSRPVGDPDRRPRRQP
jgi:hypothetical protein